MGDWRKHATPLARGHKPIRVKPPSAKGKGAKHSKLKLREYQEETVRFAEKHDFRYCLFDAPGVGKTAPSLVSIDRHRNKLTPALCIVPASVQRNWKREAEMWCKGLRAVLAPPGDEPIPRGADIVVCTWTAAYRKLNQLQKYKFKYMIVDEAHYGKSPVAQRSRAVASLAKMIPHVVLLSGTPLTNTPEELDVLRRLIGTENAPTLRRLLEEVAPDVPPKRRVQVPVELDATTRRKYDAVEEDFKQWLEDQGNLTIEDMFGVDEDGNPRKMTAEGLIKIGYLRRLAGQGKIEAAVRWISDAVRSGEPCVVFADHKHVLDGIAKGMKRIRVTYERIDGGTSKKNRQAAVDRFQHGVTPVIICSKAAKEGITLTRARHLLFAERWWTAADEEQAEDRCVAEGSLVVTRHAGLVPIEKVSIGSEVLTHRGNWKKVVDRCTRTVNARVQRQRNRHPPLVTEIKAFRYFQPLKTTYDHKVLVVRRNGADPVPAQIQPEWVPAHTILPGDFVCAPVPQHVQDMDSIEFPDSARKVHNYANNHNVEQSNGRYKPMPGNLRIDSEMLYLLGWYVAEGWVNINKNGGNCVGFSGHKKETPILEAIGKVLTSWNVSWRIIPNKKNKGTSLYAFSTDLCYLLKEWFDTGSYNKRIPKWIQDLPKHKAEHFLRGYLDGDGHYRKESWSWTSVSLTLASQIAQLAARCGYRPTLRKVNSEFGKNGYAWVGGFNIGDGGNPQHNVSDANFVYAQVSEVKTYSDKKLRVWDLTVEDDHSFVVGNAAVHNCHRLGQMYPTTMWYLMGVNTIDTRVDQIVGNKREEARKRIGVATAATVPLDKVRAVMRKGEPTAEQLATAATGDLPRLPKPTTVLRLCFHPKRWTRDEAVRWATMKGYRPRKSYTDDCSRIVLEIGERRDFHKGTYKRQNLSVDIFAVVAKRKTQAQRRRSTLGRRRRKKQPPKSVRIRREIAALRREARRLRNS